MKIALLGNMNNNFFSLMRHLREQGMDAYLFYDSERSIDHFRVKNDTWSLSKWLPYVKPLPFSMRFSRSFLFLSKRKLKSILIKNFSVFDIVVGEGSFPAIFSRAGIQLDIFIPYSNFIEWTILEDFSKIRRVIMGIVLRHYQISGVRACRRVVSSFFSEMMRDSISRLKINPFCMQPPILFCEPPPPLDQVDDQRAIIVSQKMRDADFVLFSHSRHIWGVSKKEERKFGGVKGNDILIKGFFKFLSITHFHSPLLVLFEYGPCVEKSKLLIEELGIASQVVWVPLLPRKVILFLLQFCDIGASQFGDNFWGGVGYEILSQGKLLMNKFESNSEKYESILGCPPPNLLPATTSGDVASQLGLYEENKQQYLKKGLENKRYFDKYMGAGAAKKFIEVLDCVVREKQAERVKFPED